MHFVMIQREHMEAAGLLLLQRGFDPKLLDFFCMCRYGRSPKDEKLRTFLLDETQIAAESAPTAIMFCQGSFLSFKSPEGKMISRTRRAIGWMREFILDEMLG